MQESGSEVANAGAFIAWAVWFWLGRCQRRLCDQSSRRTSCGTGDWL